MNIENYTANNVFGQRKTGAVESLWERNSSRRLHNWTDDDDDAIIGQNHELVKNL